MHFTSSIAAAVLAFASTVSAINVIGVKDRHFVDTATGEPFFVKGVDYQPGGPSNFTSGADPLSDANTCARDIYLFQRLGINTIRIYSIDPLVNHDECMTMLAAAGIYLVLDLNTPIYGQHLHATQPWTTYTPSYLEHIFTVLEVFSGYDNLLGVLAGNEVVFEDGSSAYAPKYVKAVVRDVKNYMDKHINRKIPVGYANADKTEYRISMAKYLECGADNEAVDFFGVNSYQWCGADTTYESSGYQTLVDNYKDYSLPLFFTEFGCNKPGPRVFNEVSALYSEKMTGVFSGGLVYEMTETGNDFGLVNITSNKGVKWGVEYDNLQKKFASAPKAAIPSGASTPKRPTTCSGPFPNINGSTTLPDTLGADLIKNGVSGEGSKWKRGAFLSTSQVNMRTTYTVTDSAGKTVSSPEVKIVDSVTPGSSNSSNGKKKNAAPTIVGSVGFSTIWTLTLMGAAFAVFL